MNLFCKHEYIFLRNIHGDEIIQLGYKRSISVCIHCRLLKYNDRLNEVIFVA